jgi:monoamine oxidase
VCGVLRLVAELGLELESRTCDVPPLGSLRLGGESLSLHAVQGLPGVLAELGRQHSAAVVPGRLGARQLARELDEMTVRDWIGLHVEGGTRSRLGRALELMVILNLGVATDHLSGLSLHHMFVGLPERGQNQGFAFGNESANSEAEFGDVVRSAVLDTFQVAGGNDRLARGLSARLPPDCLRLGTALRGIRHRADARYDVRIDDAAHDLLADRVVLATPLPPLRQVDLDQAGLSERRHQAIAQVLMATHRKLLVQKARQPRLDPAWPGLILTDSPPTAVWDTSFAQPGSAGLLTMFSPDPWLASPGGHAAAPVSVARAAAELIGDLAPGLGGAVGDHAWLDDWGADPWAGGSYAAFAPGQYTRFADLFSMPERAHYVE